jgi:hypothetical protein
MFKKITKKLDQWARECDRRHVDSYFKDAKDIVDVERIMRELNRKGNYIL